MKVSIVHWFFSVVFVVLAAIAVGLSTYNWKIDKPYPGPPSPIRCIDGVTVKHKTESRTFTGRGIAIQYKGSCFVLTSSLLIWPKSIFDTITIETGWGQECVSTLGYDKSIQILPLHGANRYRGVNLGRTPMQVGDLVTIGSSGISDARSWVVKKAVRSPWSKPGDPKHWVVLQGAIDDNQIGDPIYRDLNGVCGVVIGRSSENPNEVIAANLEHIKNVLESL